MENLFSDCTSDIAIFALPTPLQYIFMPVKNESTNQEIGHLAQHKAWEQRCPKKHSSTRSCVPKLCFQYILFHTAFLHQSSYLFSLT